MIRRDPVDRELTAWIAEQDRSRPDYLAEVLGVTRQTAQRPAWSFPGRWIPMQLTFERAGVPRALPYLVLVAVLVLALALAGIALVGSQRKTIPPFGPAANGHLAYETPSGDIVSMDPATAEETVLVGGPELDSGPVYSNDGTRLAFVREVDGGSAVFAADLAGGTVTRLSSSRHLEAGGPVWSPDGTRILFESDGRLWVTSTDGRGTEVELPMGNLSSAHGPMWRPPSGDEILFKGCESGLTDDCGGAPARLYLTAADGSGAPTAVSSPDTGPFAWFFTDFDPSGQRIVTQRMWDRSWEDVTILTEDQGGGFTEERLALPDDAHGWHPMLSPDGTRVATFIHEDGTTDGRRIGFVSIDDPDTLVRSGPVFQGGCGCAWSPDGTGFVVIHDSFRTILDPDGGPETTEPWLDVVAQDSTWQRLAP
jgi:hypothetical protein